MFVFPLYIYYSDGFVHYHPPRNFLTKNLEIDLLSPQYLPEICTSESLTLCIVCSISDNLIVLNGIPDIQIKHNLIAFVYQPKVW